MSKKKKFSKDNQQEDQKAFQEKMQRVHSRFARFASEIIRDEELTIVPVYIQETLQGRITFPGTFIFLKSSPEDLATAKEQLDKFAPHVPKSPQFTVVNPNMPLPPLDKVLG